MRNISKAIENTPIWFQANILLMDNNPFVAFLALFEKWRQKQWEHHVHSICLVLAMEKRTHVSIAFDAAFFTWVIADVWHFVEQQITIRNSHEYLFWISLDQVFMTNLKNLAQLFILYWIPEICGQELESWNCRLTNIDNHKKMVKSQQNKRESKNSIEHIPQPWHFVKIFIFIEKRIVSNCFDCVFSFVHFHPSHWSSVRNTICWDRKLYWFVREMHHLCVLFKHINRAV